MTIRYRIGFFDLYWMYFGPRRTSWFFVAASLWSVLLGLTLGNQGCLLLGLLTLVGGIFGFPVVLALTSGTVSALGEEVTLVIDDAGVHGWPVHKRIDRSWNNLDFGRMRRGVVTLEFLLRPSRFGWTPIPLRAVGPTQMAVFQQVMIRRAGFDPYPGRTGFPAGQPE